MLKVGTILHGTYRIDSYLSSGGFGNTYIATNVEFDERVAVKEFFMKGVTQRDDNQTTVSVSNTENHSSFLRQKEKFKKEARRIRQLNNDHIIRVHDLFEENGTAYYVMDFVDGENLAERLKHTGKPMTEEEVLDILPQILNALESVHNAGIWHLDLKPANIMVDKSGNIKLIDFGASKQLNAQKGGATTSTAISYTNGYAPREQMEQNYDKFGPWTDIYALGATLYNLLTNKRPPLPTDIDDDESEDKHKALPFPDGIGSLKFLVLQMMKTNRMQRLQSIDAVIGKLSRKVQPKQVPQKQPTTHGSTLYDDEATIIAEPSPKKEENKAEQKPEPKPEPKVTYRDTAHSSYASKTSNNNEGVSKVGPTAAILIVVAIFIIAIFVGGIADSCNNVNERQGSTESTTHPDEPMYERASWDSPIGSCEYSGPVDSDNLPHGRGEAFFSDGRYYKGSFEHGTLTGDNCYFEYKEGDFFSGEFRNNSFHYGKYTVAKDKSYYVGYYSNGQPSSGHWYDKNGKMLE